MHQRCLAEPEPRPALYAMPGGHGEEGGLPSKRARDARRQPLAAASPLNTLQPEKEAKRMPDRPPALAVPVPCSKVHRHCIMHPLPTPAGHTDGAPEQSEVLPAPGDDVCGSQHKVGGHERCDSARRRAWSKHACAC